MNATNVVSELILSLKNPLNSEAEKYYSKLTYIQEYKTVGARLPRRSGKTETLKTLASMVSSLYFNKFDPYIANRIHPHTIDKFRGIRGQGLKYQCILLDEYKEVPKEVWDIVTAMMISDMLTHDFFVLHLST